jgi:hypothetical protein
MMMRFLGAMGAADPGFLGANPHGIAVYLYSYAAFGRG